MELAQLITFNLTLLAALVSPGPAMLVALRTTLVSGRRAGVLLGLGLGTAAAIWTLLALFGLNAIFTLFPWAYLTLELIGAGYLIYLAISIWRSAATPLNTSAPGIRKHQFLRGMLVNLSNPKSMLFASTVLVVIFPRDLALADKALIVANHMIVEWIAYAGFALAMSRKPARDGYLRLKPVFDRIAATVLGLLGLRLLSDRT